MAERIPARLTAAQGRRFGLTVGAAFAVLGAIAWWRGGPTAAAVLWTVGGALIAGGLLVPTRMGPVERGWMRLAHAISRITTPIVMGAIYFLVLTPVGIVRRTFGGNPLHHDRKPESNYWQARPANARRSASMERQF